MKRFLLHILGWTLAGYITSEATYLVLQQVLKPNPIQSGEFNGPLIFKLHIMAVFVIVPWLMALLSRGLQDPKMLTGKRDLVIGFFTFLGLGAHLFVIHAIFGKPRPEVLPPYEFFTNSFFFFRWGMGGALIGMGLVCLHSLLSGVSGATATQG
ncbi:MAG: hypothetical protein KF799_10435 [Bdellovibrionales bacterium]|nr:hypothetical protein [Bdellovibrionales bacterium]